MRLESAVMAPPIRSIAPILRTPSLRFALALLLVQSGSALANIPAADGSAKAGPVTILSIGERSAPALPVTDNPLTTSRVRAGAARSRYFPLELGPRLAFVANTSNQTGAQNGSVTPPPPEKAQRAAGSRAPAAKSASARPAMPVQIVKSTAPGQGGYVHFFIIESPEGETETQIGIELPDGRIAWSIPEIGVSVSPFVQSGHVMAN